MSGTGARWPSSTEGLRARARRWRGEVLRRTAEQLTDWCAADQHSGLARRFAAFGPGTVVTFPRGAVHGEAFISLGSGVLVSPHVTLAAGIVPDQDLGSEPILRIGDGCLLGRGTAIVAHADIELGDDVFTGMNVYITDQNHAYQDLDRPIGRQNPVNAPVRIGSGTWIGSGAVILPGAAVGRQVVVAANAVVRGVVPDHSVVAGVPAQIVRHHHLGAWQAPDEIVVDQERNRSSVSK